MLTHLEHSETVVQLPMQDSVGQAEAQRMLEYQYARHHTLPRIERAITDSTELCTAMVQVMVNIKAWLEQEHPKSKELRLRKFKGYTDQDWEKLIVKVTARMCFFDYTTALVQAVPTMIGPLKYDNKGDAVQTLSEMLIHWHNTGLITIALMPAIGEGERFRAETLGFHCEISLPQELGQAIARTRFMPPMVCEPAPIEGNNQSPHLTYNKSVLLNNSHHEEFLALDVVNILNRTPFTLDMDFLLNVDQLPVKELTSLLAVQHWDRYIAGSLEVYELINRLSQANPDMPGAVYFANNLDKRGRNYCEGYEANLQGTAHQRAAIDFHELQWIAVPAERFQFVDYELNASQNPYWDIERQQPENQISLSGFEYCLQDLAVQWGYDKTDFQERLDWAYEHMGQFETMAAQTDWPHKASGKNMPCSSKLRWC